MIKDAHGGDVYRYNREIIDFSSNINPLGLDERIKNAIIDAVDDVVKYPDVRCEKLREAISKHEGTDKEFITCGNGAAELIFDIVRAVKPKSVLLCEPCFSEYEKAAYAVGADIIRYTAKESEYFKLQADYFDLIKKCDMLFLCNPNNPTGTLLEKETVLNIIKAAKENDKTVVLDECFNDFLDDAERYSFVRYVNKYDNLIILKAFTKMYSVAGLRLGYCITSNKDININDVRQAWSVSVLAQAAGIAALKYSDIPGRVREYVKSEREYLTHELKKLNVKFFQPSANYIFFKSGAGLADKLLEHDILIRDCSNYGGLTKGYYRIAVKTHGENVLLIKALKEISEVENG